MMERSLSQQLQQKRYLLVQAFLCVVCTVVGALYPSLLDWSKTAMVEEKVRSVDEHGRHLVRSREYHAYPFSPVSVVLVDVFLQLSIALSLVSYKLGLRTLFADRRVVLRVLPLGIIYALGELMTLRSVQKASGPAYVVIANMKLVIAAVMSRVYFGNAWALPFGHWLELVLISLAAGLFSLIEASSLGQQWHWEGAWMALAKSALASCVSVFCEDTYKSNSFYVVLTLQAFWGFLAILCLIAVSAAGLALPGLAMELRDESGAWALFAGGPAQPLCGSAAYQECLNGLRAAAAAGSATCMCISRRGWDIYTFGTIVADISNAVSTALVFKRLSAVAKYVCRATSALPMYIAHCLLGRSAWDPLAFIVIIFLCMLVTLYTVQRHQAMLRALPAAVRKQHET